VPPGHFAVTKAPGLPLGDAKIVVLRGAGAGATVIEGTGVFPVVNVQPGASAPVALEDLTLGPGSWAIDDSAPSATLAVRHTVVSGLDNSAVHLNNAARVDIVDSAFIGDSNSTTGGAIQTFGTTVNVIRSTFSGNKAIVGGAIRVGSGTVNIVDSTLTGNSATGSGGALAGAGIVLRHDTIAGNSAATSGGGISTSGSVTLEGTILSGNSPGQCEGGTLNTAGTNIVFGPSTCTVSGPAPTTSDPRLGPLAPHGGFGETMALLAGSSALNAAATPCPGAAFEAEPALDERGVARPQGAACDIGAFESAADGAVALSASPNPLALGGTLSLTATARNAGAETLTGVQITIALPAGTTGVSAPAGCSATFGAGGAVVCPVSELAPGQTHPVTIQVRPQHTGALVETASVSVAQADFNPADDTTTIASVVSPPSTGGGGKTVAGSSVRGGTLHVDAHGNVTVVLRCPAGAPGGCRDAVDLYGTRGKLPARATARAKRLASAHVLVRAGSSKRVRMRLSASGRRLLARGRHLKARVLLTASPGSGAGPVYTTKATVTLVRSR
jgi:uncharacterized repeat protein (TIGR01451 family)